MLTDYFVCQMFVSKLRKHLGIQNYCIRNLLSLGQIFKMNFRC